MLLVVRVLLLVEVPQTICLVHKRFPRLLVQFLPPANIQSVFKIQNQCELKIHLLALFLLILPPLSLSTPLSSVSHFLRTYFPAGTSPLLLTRSLKSSSEHRRKCICSVFTLSMCFVEIFETKIFPTPFFATQP